MSSQISDDPMPGQKQEKVTTCPNQTWLNTDKNSTMTSISDIF